MAQHPAASGLATVNNASAYLVIVEEDPTGVSAYVPDLPGCIAAGGTREEVEVLIREGIALYVATLRERGQPVPRPTSRPFLVSVAGVA